MSRLLAIPTLFRSGAWMLALLLLWPGRVLALEAVALAPELERQQLGEGLSVLRDVNRDLKVEDVVAQKSQFRPHEDPAVDSSGLGEWVQWARLSVRNPHDEPMDVALHLEDAHNWDAVDVYEWRGDRARFRWKLGRLGELSRKPYGAVEVAWPCRLEAGQTRTWLLRIETRGPDVEFLPSAWEPGALLREIRHRDAWRWGYSGLFLLGALYHLMLFARLRDRGYLYFAGICLASMGLDFSGFGQLQQLGRWEAPPLMPAAFGPFGVLLSGLWCLFTSHALNGRATMPRLHRVLAAVASVELLLGCVLFLAPGLYSMRVLFACSALSMALCVAAGVRGMKVGYAPAKLYLWTWGVYFLGVGLNIASSMGVLELGVFRSQCARIGVSIQILMFALVLAERYALINRKNEQTQRELLETQRARMAAQAEAMQAQNHALEVEREAAATLQRKVDERTEELAERTREAEQARSMAEEEHALAEEAREMAEREHVLADHARAQVEAMDQQKTRFFQNISHELRTPLTLILNPLREEAQGQPDNENLQVASRNSRRLLRLVNQLLDFQKLKAGRRTLRLVSMDLCHFVRASAACFEPSCHHKQVTLRLTVGGAAATEETPPIHVLGELDAMEKILFNYLSNALKHSPKQAEIGLDLTRRAGKVRLSVRDEGEGIAEGDRQHLFEVFRQVDSSASREHEGTGLGLALVKQLAAALDGTVGVESKVDRGASFWLELPELAEAERGCQEEVSLDDFTVKPWLLADGEDQHISIGPSPPVAPANDENASGPRERVLVVDDLVDMRELVARTLERQGYRVSVADQGQRALEMARKDPPDLVITDWMMPRMTGPELVKAMREDAHLARVPVVLLTAKSDEESKINATVAGANAFLGKPFDDQELLATARNLLALKSREREVERLNQKLLKQGLARCLPPALLEGMLRGEMELTQTPRVQKLSVLSARLAGFEHQLRKLPPEVSGGLLDNYLEATSRMAFAHHGTLTHFAGDRLDVLFGAPDPMPDDEALHSALFCGLHMHQAVYELSACWKEAGLQPPQLCVGVHRGEALVGTFGSELRSEYTAIGPAMAMAEKLAQVASPGSVTLCASVATELPPGSSHDAGRMVLQGEREAIPLARLNIEHSGYLHQAGDHEATG